MTSSSQPVPAVRPFQVMLKPRGPICNLDCKYCYYLSKEQLFPDSTFRMPVSLLEVYIRQLIEAQPGTEVTFAWQGGEPTLIGLEFFQQAIAYQQQYARPGMHIENTLQTNGTLLNDAWCAFFKQHDFLIGISLDGPRAVHDAYRVDKGGRPTFDRVMAGIALLKKHGVAFNILTTVHAANCDHGLEVYRFLRDEVQTQFIQFIPIVERTGADSASGETLVTDRSVTGADYGRFLIAVFDEWARRDVGNVFVQIFDVALATWSGHRPGLCIFEKMCGSALAMEHNGDLYSCDHFVEPEYHLGNILEVPMAELAQSEAQRAFGRAKRDALPHMCRACDVRFVCNGGCPKNRLLHTPDGEPGLNWLCDGYQMFFRHIAPAMQFMAAELHAGRSPANLVAVLARQDAERAQRFKEVGRNDPCPCGSGRKYKHCHGKPH